MATLVNYTYIVVLGGINFCSHNYCAKFNTVITILYTYYSMSIYYIKLKSRLSVRHADISAVSAAIEMGLARNES